MNFWFVLLVLPIGFGCYLYGYARALGSANHRIEAMLSMMASHAAADVAITAFHIETEWVAD